jgi:hypothetical protein
VAVNHHYAAHFLHLPHHGAALLAAVETSIAGVQFPLYRFGLSHRCVKTPWPESASEVHRPSGRRLPSKLVPTFADIWSHMVSVTNPYDRILGFLDRKLYPRALGSGSSSRYIATDGQSAVLLGVVPLLERLARCYISLSDNYFF